MSNLTNDNTFQATHPTDNIQCRTCMFRDGGTIWSNDYHKAHCLKFPHPHLKPIGVLTLNENCAEYRKDEGYEEK